MAQATESGGSKKVVSRKYNPYTGKWEDVYGPASSSSGSSKKKTTPKKKATSSGSNSNSSANKKKTTPAKPTTPDKGTNRGSGTDNKETVVERTRQIEYDLEGSAEVSPIHDLVARHMVDFQGLGINFSGKYFLSSVTHTINRSGYSMQLEVLRNNFVWRTSPVKAPSKSPSPTNKKKVTPKKKAKPARYYTVKRGDTLWAISKRYYGRGSLYMRIVNANRSKIKDPHWIYPKQKFLIP